MIVGEYSKLKLHRTILGTKINNILWERGGERERRERERESRVREKKNRILTSDIVYTIEDQ